VINKEDLIDLSKINKKILKNNLILGPIGLNLNYYKYSKIDTKNLKFIYIGRIHYEKGIKNLIDAAHIVNQKYNNVSFSIIGEIDPKSTKEFKTFIKNQKKYDYLNFLGYMSDIREQLKLHSVLILPTFYREGSPRTIQESIACGRPFITTNIPGCKELLDNGMNGYQCKINDSTNLSTIIIDIINNKSDLEIKSQNCQKYSEKYLDSKIINERFIKFLGIK
jgi:glycosyltransferase involved in cell wall biosynthesis